MLSGLYPSMGVHSYSVHRRYAPKKLISKQRLFARSDILYLFTEDQSLLPTEICLSGLQCNDRSVMQLYGQKGGRPRVHCSTTPHVRVLKVTIIYLNVSLHAIKYAPKICLNTSCGNSASACKFDK